MMDFSNVINDLIKLEGIRLNSIRPGAEITIKQVDIVQKKVVVEASSGKLQSRSFSEFQRIWEALQSAPAIRVEEVLNGSGSSRNQPETIFANLPYIQWVKIDNKKHIAYVGTPTHPYGTIQQMDSMRAAQLEVNRNSFAKNDKTVMLIVTDDIPQTAKAIASIVGKSGDAEREGLYIYNLADQILVLAESVRMGLPCGTYAELHLAVKGSTKQRINLLGYVWSVVHEGDLKAIVRI